MMEIFLQVTLTLTKKGLKIDLFVIDYSPPAQCPCGRVSALKLLGCEFKSRPNRTKGSKNEKRLPFLMDQTNITQLRDT